MDVEINAYGKYVKLTDMECAETPDCTEVAFELWDRLEKPVIATVESADEEPTLQASGGGHAERTYQPMGYAYLGDGERLQIK